MLINLLYLVCLNGELLKLLIKTDANKIEINEKLLNSEILWNGFLKVKFKKC